MSRATTFLAGFGTAAAIAAALWSLRIGPETGAAKTRAQDAEDALRAARRDAADRGNEASMERARNGELEDRIRELERQLTAEVPRQPPPADSAGGAGGHAMRTAQDPPEQWDAKRLSQEFENIAAAGPAVPQHPRLPLLVRGFRAQGENGVSTIRQIVSNASWDAPMVVTAVLVGAELGDRSLVEPFFVRWRSEKDADVRYALLRALAVLPGDEIVPGLLDTWIDPKAARHARGVAIEGLGRRGIETAVEVAAATAGGTGDPALRARALIGLRDYAEKGGWKDAALPLAFGKALRTADGDTQRRIALTTLEGFWSEAAARELAAFAADGAAPAALAVRAKKAADAILGGEPRPESAGSLDSGLRKSE